MIEGIDLSDLRSNEPNVKYACAKEAIRISAQHSDLLYPAFDVFLELLDSEKTVLVWAALKVLGNLSEVDAGNRIGEVLPKLRSLLRSESMITSSHAMVALAKVAKHKLSYAPDIVSDLLQVENMTYRTRGTVSPECRNIAIGHLLDALRTELPMMLGQCEVREFLYRQSANPRTAVAKRATALLKLAIKSTPC